MEGFLTHFTYAGMILLLLAGGVGLPIPEDVDTHHQRVSVRHTGSPIYQSRFYLRCCRS